jgi:DNA-directed RNA polymerase I subunit RPA1
LYFTLLFHSLTFSFPLPPSTNSYKFTFNSFYSDQDVRDRSVAEITSSQAFDPTHNPLPGGLYDPRLGPTTKDSDPVCCTCALSATACPGHFGHIELAVPVYHPLLMGDLVQALRLKCLNCHKLRAAARPLAIHRAKFNLLKQHKIAELLDLDDTLAQSVRQARDGGGGGEVDSAALTNSAANKRAAGVALDSALRDFQPSREESANYLANSSNRRHQAETSYERKLRKQLIHECMAACKGAKTCPHCGACSPKIRQDSSNKIFQAALSAKMSRMNAAEGIQLLSALQTDKEAGYDSDDTDRGKDNNSDDDKDDDDDSDVEDKEDDKGNSKIEKRDQYMHAGEVFAQMKRMWKLDPYLCNFIFGTCGSWSEEGFHIFFLQAVPVPPSRFRPAMHLNGMAVEHSQTQYLSKMITLNEQVRNNFAAGNEPRAYTSWIDLQTAVNCYMDSSKDPSAAATAQVAPGIRQLLERKEGLFRKNMMGKRVDYACRSVISPDPYVGTNEIGLPQYFARVLTYPTPVTDLNLKEMRQLVERGAHNYPGARWVEINGKRVDLSKMKRFKREAVAAQLLTHLKKGGMPAFVGRQLRDGDYVLMNRQVRWRGGCVFVFVSMLQLKGPRMRLQVMHHADTEMTDYDTIYR